MEGVDWVDVENGKLVNATPTIARSCEIKSPYDLKCEDDS